MIAVRRPRTTAVLERPHVRSAHPAIREATGMASPALSPATARWFADTFPDGPTPAQERGWPAIARGANVLIQAPTGSGKTLAAFLHAIDRLGTTAPTGGVRLLYVSPLK